MRELGEWIPDWAANQKLRQLKNTLETKFKKTIYHFEKSIFLVVFYVQF